MKYGEGVMRRILLIGVVMCLGVSACGTKSSKVPKRRVSATSTTLSPPTTYPPVDPATYAVPAVIDKAYIEHVLAGLDHEQGNALRILVKSKNTDDEAWQRKMQSITTDTQFAGEEKYGRLLIKDNFSELRQIPGDPRTMVQKSFIANAGCIFASVNKDFTGQLRITPSDTRQRYIALVPKSGDFTEENPTPWDFAYDGSQADGGKPESPC